MTSSRASGEANRQYSSGQSDFESGRSVFESEGRTTKETDTARMSSRGENRGGKRGKRGRATNSSGGGNSNRAENAE